MNNLPKNWPSVRILEDRCSHWLRSNGYQNVRFQGKPTFGREAVGSAKTDLQNIVLFGEFPKSLARSHRWLEKRYRFWTMCSVARNACIEILDLPEESVGVIPRYELFPRLAPVREIPKKGQSWTLVYSGRICYGKNALLAARVAHRLQTEYNEKVRLVFVGAFDATGREDLGIGSVKGFETEFRNACDAFGWIVKPKFFPRMLPEEWLKLPVERPVLISLSQSPWEDFGVNVAQAQSSGWPCILSDWGGHRDVEGKNVLHIPNREIGDPREENVVQDTRARMIAARIHDRAWARSTDTLRPNHEQGLIAPTVPVSRQDLLKIRRRNARFRFPTKHHVDPWSRYAWTSQGCVYYGWYRTIFGGRSSRRVAGILTRPFPRWASMEEVFPAIEAGLTGVAFHDPRIETRFLHWKQQESADNFTEISGATAIALEFIDPEILQNLRGIFDFRSRLLLYTHGEGTRYFAKLGRHSALLNENDIFVCASHAEARTVRNSFTNATVRVVPFAVRESSPRRSKKSSSSGNPRLAYAGRISEQKNLHTLFLSLALMRDHLSLRVPRLDIFGSEDELGSPNMGMASKDYLRRLKKLARDLRIESSIHWHGFVPRDRLWKEIDAHRSIFVSPSLHSDEDFGVAALTWLGAGRPAVLSAWGGHLDFNKNFPAAVELVPVRGSSAGPWISPVELAKAIGTQLKKLSRGTSTRVDSGKYDLLNISGQTLALLKGSSMTGARPLISSPERVQLLSQNKVLKRDVIFKGYTDPLALKAFKAYGMGRSLKAPRNLLNRSIYIFPWVELGSGEVRVDDPHRGTHQLRTKDRNEKLRWIVEMGFGVLL